MIRLCRLVGGFRECSRRFSSGNGPFVSQVWGFPLIQEALFLRGWTAHVRWLGITPCAQVINTMLSLFAGACATSTELFLFLECRPERFASAAIGNRPSFGPFPYLRGDTDPLIVHCVVIVSGVCAAAVFFILKEACVRYAKRLGERAPIYL